MSKLIDWLRLRRAAGDPSTREHLPVIRAVLSHWDVGRSRVRSHLGDSSANSWLIEGRDRPYVLRRAGYSASYLEYQIRVLRHLVASDFPYEAPRLLVTNAGADYVRDGEWQWLLYPFIEGHDAPDPGSEDQARDIGALVAHYHRAMRGFEPVETERRFVLDTFQRDHIDATFAESAGPLRGQEAAADLAEEYLAHRKTILDAHQNLDPLELARVNDLEKTTIYYDWHRYNMVARAGRIVGLIDYDSVIEAPRIVDVQNALTYIIIGDDEPSWDLVAAFAEGYGSVERLSIDEARLVPTLMRDQATWLVADVVTEIRAQGASPRARLAIQLIHLLTRLDENAAALVADLADPSRSVPEDVS